MGCDGLCFTGKTYDDCGQCGGDGSLCAIIGSASSATSFVYASRFTDKIKDFMYLTVMIIVFVLLII